MAAVAAAGDTGILLTNTNSNVAISLVGAGPAFEDTTTVITPAALMASTAATETIEYVTASGGDQTCGPVQHQSRLRRATRRTPSRC